MANWNDPTLSSLYADFLSELKARDQDLAQMFDVGSPTNIPTSAIRWNSTNSRFEIWGGSSWSALDSEYDINVTTLGGSAAAAYLLASGHQGAGGAEHANATGSVAGFMSASDKTDFDAATDAPTVPTDSDVPQK